LTALQAGLVALAAYPAQALGGRAGLEAMLLGAGLAWMAVVASYVGIVLAFRRAALLPVVIVVGGFLVRFALLFGLLWLVARTTTIDLGRLVIWIVGFYMVLVVAEAWSLATGLKRGT
jgi:hypothetical protein